MAKIGLVPLVIGEDLKKDYWGTMKKVKEIGFDGIELGVFPAIEDLSPKEIKEKFDDIGLEIVNIHGLIDDFKNRLDDIIENARIFGVKYVTLVWTPFDSKEWFDRELPHILAAAKNLKAEGLEFLYHNHDHEFLNSFDGKRAIDWLFDTISEDLIKGEIDTAWVQVGNDDPARYISQMGERCKLVHTKDVIMQDGKPQMVELGTGEVDFAEVAKVVKEIKCEWLISEQDTGYQLPGLESIALSYNNLKALIS